jgi:hypothetical protein
MSTALRICLPEPDPSPTEVRSAPSFEPIAPRPWRSDRLDDQPPSTRAATVRPLNRMLPSEDELRKFLRYLLEVVAGQRPAAQLAHWFSPPLARKLRWLAVTRHLQRPRHLNQHWISVVEDNAGMELWGTAVRLDCPGTRVEAFAGRIETHGLSWRCTEFGILTADRSPY